MGIDIYMKWEGQTEEEERAQITGFEVSGRAGGVGYLREAYHGAPYATMFFVGEAFGEDPQSVLEGVEQMMQEVESGLKASGHQIDTGGARRRLGGNQPNFGADERVQPVEVWDERHQEHNTYYAYPAELLRSRLPMASTIANLRGELVYGSEDGHPDMVEALVAFTELAERIEAEGKGPVVIRSG